MHWTHLKFRRRQVGTNLTFWIRRIPSPFGLQWASFSQFFWSLCNFLLRANISSSSECNSQPDQSFGESWHMLLNIPSMPLALNYPPRYQCQIHWSDLMSSHFSIFFYLKTPVAGLKFTSLQKKNIQFSLLIIRTGTLFWYELQESFSLQKPCPSTTFFHCLFLQFQNLWWIAWSESIC